MIKPISPPERKNPLRRTRLPISPQRARSRAAHGLTAAAAEGRFALQVCADCQTVIYPPREACPACLSSSIAYDEVRAGGMLLAETTVRVSNEPYFRERTPWRIGAIKLDVGPVAIAHLHGDTVEKGRVRLEIKLDRSGAPVLLALPEKDTPDMADDPQWRELTSDPKFRRILITDGRTTVGQMMVKALLDADAALVFVGVADLWKPFPGLNELRGLDKVEIVPFDLTDSESVVELAKQNGGRIDIIVNTAEHVRPGGVIDRKGLTAARDEMDVRYFGLVRLAQAFGPAMRSRGADGVNSATAFVNLLSVHALMNWPAYGVHSSIEAACLSAAQCLRAELRPGGVKVINVFSGPLETEWFQTVPPPKVSPAQLAKSVVDALRRGIEDVFVGDVAQEMRARLASNPKALERELGG